MRYLPYYRLYGFRRMSNFLKPPILKEEDFKFPYFSSFHYFKPTSIIENMNPEATLLKNTLEAVVRNEFEYKGETAGNFRKVNIKMFDIIKTMRSSARRWRFPLDPNTKVVLKNKTLLIYNYTTLNKRYIYTSYPLFRHDQYYNSLRSCIETINNDTAENKFLFLELPEEVYSFALMNRLERDSGSLIKKIHDYRYFTMLELWKYITNDPDKPSLFNEITNQNDVTLMLYNEGKVVLLALGVLRKFITKDELIVKTESDMLDINMEDIMSAFNLTFKNPSMEADYSMYKIKPIDTKLLKKMMILTWNNIINTPIIEVPTPEITPQKLAEAESHPVEEEEVVDMNQINTAIETQVDKITEETSTAVDEAEFEQEVLDFNPEEEDVEPITIKRKSKNEYEELDMSSILSDFEKSVDELNNIKIEKLKEDGVVNKAKAKSLKESIEKKRTIPTPYKDLGNLSIQEVIQEEQPIELDKNLAVKTDNVVVLDKSMNKDLVSVFNAEYSKKLMKKDTIKTVASLEKAGFILTDYKIEEDRSILGGVDKHIVTFKGMNGKTFNTTFFLPEFKEDGTYVENRNQYKIRLQRTEVPIIKLNNKRVLLNSYYSKLFVDKAERKADDYGFKLLKEITLSENITKLVLEDIVIYNQELPKLYELIMRKVKSFVFNSRVTFLFSYAERFSLVIDPKARPTVEQLEKRFNGILCGVDNSAFYFLTFDNLIKRYDMSKQQEEDYTKLHEELGITKERIYSEFVSLKVLGENVPLYLVFAYYVGIENALKLFNMQYRILKKEDKDFKRPERDENTIVIKLSDAYIIIQRDFALGDSVFVGAVKDHKELSKLPFSVFNTKENMNTVFTVLGYANQVRNEVRILNQFFIDPMTKDLLKSMGEPTTFILLLKRACELLVTDKRTNPDNIENSVIKGIERVNGMLYAEMVKAVKAYENKNENGRANFSFDPYAVIKKLKEDNTQVLCNDTNPISLLAQHREVTLLGEGGRQEISVRNEDRKYSESFYGTITEHFKDSGSSGIVAQLASTPYIENARGKINIKDRKITGSGETLSIAGQLRPFSLNEDNKRLDKVGRYCSDAVV